MTNDFVAGLVQGEGSFHISINRAGEKHHIHPSFQLKLWIHDKEVVDKVHEALGTGSCSIVRRNNAGTNPTCDQYQLASHSIKGSLKIIKFFDRVDLYSSKKKAYENWKEAVIWLSQLPRGSLSHPEIIKKTRERRKLINPYSSRSKD